MGTRVKILVVIAISMAAATASIPLLTSIGGPTEAGLHCMRTSAGGECEVRRSRSLGLAGNSSFTIPEGSIRGARAACAGAHVGGRGGPSCEVYLVLDSLSGPMVPVLSYALAGQADAAALRLNEYLLDRSASSIEIDQDIRTPLLWFGVIPILLVGVVLGLRWWRFGRKSPEMPT